MKKTPKEKKILTVQLQKLVGASWHPRAMKFEPRQSEVEFGEIRDEWFLQVCHLATETAAARASEGSSVVRVGGYDGFSKRFYDRVRKSSGWLQKFFADSKKEFAELVTSSYLEGEYWCWVGAEIEIRFEEVNGEGERLRLIDCDEEFDSIVEDVSSLYKKYHEKFYVECTPRGAIDPMELDVTNEDSVIENGDYVQMFFSVDVSCDLMAFVVTERGVVGVFPKLEKCLEARGHRRGSLEREQMKTKFCFPEMDPFKVVIKNYPYFFVTVARYGDDLLFKKAEVFRLRQGLEGMRKELAEQSGFPKTGLYDLRRVRHSKNVENGEDLKKWLKPVCDALPARVDFARLIVAAPRGNG